MNTPEKIYLQWDNENVESWFEFTWCKDKINDDDIEYIRSDKVQQLVEATKRAIAHLDASYIWEGQNALEKALAQYHKE